MTTSNCMTCIYGSSWCGGISTEPGHCYMFKDEPDGVCGQWRTSITPPPATGERVKVGDSQFESWYSELQQAGKGSKQIAREAYEAGLNEAAQQVAVPMTNGEIYTAYITAASQTLRPQDERIALAFARAIEAFHGIGVKP